MRQKRQGKKFIRTYERWKKTYPTDDENVLIIVHRFTA